MGTFSTTRDLGYCVARPKLCCKPANGKWLEPTKPRDSLCNLAQGIQKEARQGMGGQTMEIPVGKPLPALTTITVVDPNLYLPYLPCDHHYQVGLNCISPALSSPYGLLLDLSTATRSIAIINYGASQFSQLIRFEVRIKVIKVR